MKSTYYNLFKSLLDYQQGVGKGNPTTIIFSQLTTYDGIKTCSIMLSHIRWMHASCIGHMD